MTPAEDFEQRLDEQRRLARRRVRRWALKSLISFATIPVMLSACCIFASGAGRETPEWMVAAAGYGLLISVCIAALIVLGTAICAGVLTFRDWSLLDWRTQAMGIAPWLIVSGICLLLLLAVLG